VLPSPGPLPRNIAPNQLEARRIKGNKLIMPDPDDQAAMDANEVRVITSVKLCVDKAGKVIQVRQLKSSGYPGYDTKILREITDWAYRPYKVDGKPVPVCTAVTFIYQP
jgi:TonB family protein